MNTLLIDALHCRNTGRPPVWLMRQAGRYMPAYRKIRAQHSFLEMCHHSELAAEVTLLPIKQFNMDAAILFSDILVIPEALNVGLRFEDSKGPIIERPLQTANDVLALPAIKISDSLDYVAQIIKNLIPALKVPLVGFCGAPFTLASYMIEGGSSRDLKKTKQWLLRDPVSFHHLLSLLADYCIDYLKLQAKAGVSALQIFDSWAHVLAFAQFQEFSLAYFNKIVQGLAQEKIPLILFCRGSSVFAPALATLQPAAISLDWNADMAHMRSCIPRHIALQGNLDPHFLYAPLPLLQQEVGRHLKSMQQEQGYIFNLGHGIAPDVSPDAVKALVEKVQNG